MLTLVLAAGHSTSVVTRASEGWLSAAAFDGVRASRSSPAGAPAVALVPVPVNVELPPLPGSSTGAVSTATTGANDGL